MNHYSEKMSCSPPDRVEELNHRILDRYQSDKPLEPNFSPRSVCTKYSRFPIVNLRTQSTIPIQPMANYSVNTNFNPGNSRGPTSGYVNNIDKESQLYFQPQISSKQDNGIYVPSSESSLYKTWIVSRPVEQTHPLLFQHDNHWEDTTGSFIREFPIVGSQLLNNSTRCQLRGDI